MKRLVVLLMLALLAGCAAPQGRIRPVTLDELREIRAGQLEARLQSRLVVSLRDERVTELPDEALQAALLEEGLDLAREVDLELVEHYAIDVLGLYVYVLEGRSAHAVERAISRLSKTPGVERVQRANLFRTQSIERDDDPLGPLQALPADQLEALHAVATGRGVTIAIVDTGLDLAHEDFRGANIEARDLVTEQASVPVETHATAVTGLIAAQPGNGLGIVGLAPGARVIGLRACWQESSEGAAFCNTFTLARALAAALAEDVDVVNLSLTGPMDPLLVQLIDALLARNVIVVGAHADEPGQGAFPASLPGVIAATARPVLARDPGPVYAPGDDVITLLPRNRYGLRDGSSISAAQVSGVAGLLRERDPDITAEAVQALLHGRDVESEGLAGLLEALERAGR